MEPVHPRGFEPMLASTGLLGDESAMGFEPKLDGWRSSVHVTERGVAVYTRTGRQVAASVPELAAIVDALAVGTVLDGELVAGSGGASTFYRLGPLLASRPERRRSTVTFAAFDVLAVAGVTVMDQPYEERRRRLEALAFAGPAWCTVPSWRGVAAADVLSACRQHDVEGILAKRLSSRYWPGRRRPDWLKLKTVEWRQAHAGRRHEHRPLASTAG
jgi:bifunctional non-homologous end joining protein LigD